MRISDWSSDVCSSDLDVVVRSAAALRADLLTPLAKAWSTDEGVRLTSLAVQVHGGMGFIEETGIAQRYRDARIAPIYEGTNGIQAIDLVSRKVRRDGGAAMQALLDELARDLAPLTGRADLEQAVGLVEAATTSLAKRSEEHTSELQSLMRIS